MADRGLGDARDLHGSARHVRRQRLAAAHRRKPFGDDGRINVGINELSNFQCDHSSRDELAGPRLRSQTIPDRLHRDLHVVVGAVWRRNESGHVAGCARSARRRRRSFAADRAGGVVGEFSR